MCLTYQRSLGRKRKVMKKIVLSLFFVITALSFATAQRGEIYPANENALETAVSIYPNPAVEYLTVEFDLEEELNVSFQLYNILGTQLTVKPEKEDENLYKLDVRTLNDGYYMLVMKQEGTNNTRAFKFLKR